MLKILKYFLLFSVPVFLLFVLAFVIMFVTGWNRQINVIPGGQYKYVGRLSDPYKEVSMPVPPHIQTEINAWLSETHRWCFDMNSYVGPDVIRADNFHLRCLADRIAVLNYRTKYKNIGWVQCTCPMDDTLRSIVASLREELEKAENSEEKER
ncbi:MAG: hypothetical protein ACRC10_09470 [Thermoguttaceae bacterium]